MCGCLLTDVAIDRGTCSQGVIARAWAVGEARPSGYNLYNAAPVHGDAAVERPTCNEASKGPTRDEH